MTDLDAEYKRRFHALTVQLGRVPTPADREWLELTEWHRRAHMAAPAETEATMWARDRRLEQKGWLDRDTTGATIVRSGKQSRGMDSGTGISAMGAATTSCATSAVTSGPMTMNAELAPAAPESPAPAATPNLERAREDDPGGTRPLPLYGPGARAVGEVGPSEPDGVNGAGGICQGEMGAATPVASPVRGSRGPGGGIYAVCGECRRVWERPKRKGRPGKICGDCASS